MTTATMSMATMNSTKATTKQTITKKCPPNIIKIYLEKPKIEHIFCKLVGVNIRTT